MDQTKVMKKERNKSKSKASLCRDLNEEGETQIPPRC